MNDFAAPIWLLDIDGVLNALKQDDGTPHPHWPDMVRKGVSTSHSVVFDLTLSESVIAFINGHKAAGVDIRWATTWQEDANRFVAPAFGLPQLPNGAEALGMSDYYYKERAALKAIDNNRPLIWTDDDAIRLMVRAEIEQSGVPNLLIEPDPWFGLTPEHLDAIAAFLAKHS